MFELYNNPHEIYSVLIFLNQWKSDGNNKCLYQVFKIKLNLKVIFEDIFCTLICECYFFLDKYIYLEKQIEHFAQVVTILIDS